VRFRCGKAGSSRPILPRSLARYPARAKARYGCSGGTVWGKNPQYLPGHDLGVLDLGGLQGVLVVSMAHLYRIGRREPGPAHQCRCSANTGTGWASVSATNPRIIPTLSMTPRSP
jgi:hypothetical protein